MKIVDGGRQRCVDCGHPRKEHHREVGCTVPNCPCAEHQLAGADATGKKGATDSS